MRDVRHALRNFARSPGFTAVLLLTLALGIGANTAVFSILEGTLLRPLPYKNPASLINILDASPREKELAKIFASYSDFEEYARHARTLERLGAATWAGRTGAVLTGRGPAKSYLTIPVTADFFGTLGVLAQLGRLFNSADLRGGCAVMLSDKFWRGTLASDPKIVGESLSLNDQACAVVGVMPRAFAFYPPETQIWTLLLPNDPRLKKYFGVFIVARLAPGATISQAQAELTALHAALHTDGSNGEDQFAPIAGGLQDQFTWLAGRNLRTTLGVLFAAVLALLTIACLNVANLLIGRLEARRREFAIRAALGSGGWRLLRQLFTEAALLTAAGAALGLLVAFSAVSYFMRVQPIELPVGASVSVNLAALAFTIAVSAAAAVFFATVPAWTVSGTDIEPELRAGGRSPSPRRQRLARAMISVEMGLSVILLTGAGLLMQSVLNFGSAPLGFATDNVTVAGGTLPRDRYRDPEKKAGLYDEIQRTIARLPGVENSTIASSAPPYGLGLDAIEVQGKSVPRDLQLHDVGQSAVGPAYFKALMIPVKAGRAFDARDQRQSGPVAIVNEALAREYFPDRSPLGQQIRLGEEEEWLTVVGVAGDERRPQVLQEMSWIAKPAVYRPLNQKPPDSFSIITRGALQPGFAHSLEQSLASIDPGVATGGVETMRTRLAPYLKYPEFRAAVLAAFAALALLLAAVGLYGVLAQFVVQRSREIGVRMAVGANARDIARWVTAKGGAPVLTGLIAGFASAIELTQYLSAFLYGIPPDDPLTLGGVCLIIAGVAAAAMFLPALRASRVDPMVALRRE
jgi:putative ABC transport system permease protein